MGSQVGRMFPPVVSFSIYEYEGLGFQGVYNKVLKLSDITSCICDEDGSLFKREKVF